MIFEPKKVKSITVSIVSPSICRDMMGCHDLSFLNVVLSQLFHSPFSLSSRGSFRSSLLSAISVVSSAYLRLLILLMAVLIPACTSSSPAFHIMYSPYKLNKQGDNIQP